jgi:hypothetical protein
LISGLPKKNQYMPLLFPSQNTNRHRLPYSIESGDMCQMRKNLNAMFLHCERLSDVKDESF